MMSRMEGQVSRVLTPVSEHHQGETDQQQIRERAYYKWQAAGTPPSDGVDFWLQAEREVREQRRPR